MTELPFPQDEPAPGPRFDPIPPENPPRPVLLPDAPTPWHITLFGPLRASRDGRVVMSFRTQRAKSMLALLVHADGVPISRLVIADKLWPESPSGQTNLATELFHLRRCFDEQDRPFFEAAGGNLSIPNDRYTCDVHAFQAALADAEAAESDRDDGRRLAALERAVALYAGPFAQDIYDDWTNAYRQDLLEKAVAAYVDLAVGYAAGGAGKKAIPHARHALALDPLNEVAAATLLSVLLTERGRGPAKREANVIGAAYANEGLALPQGVADVLARIDAQGRETLPEPPVSPTSTFEPNTQPTRGRRPEPSGDTETDPESDPAPVAVAAVRPLPVGTLTFVIAQEAPDDRRVPPAPVRGRPWLPKSEQAKLNAAPEDPAEAAAMRARARKLAWSVVDTGVVRDGGWMLARAEGLRVAVFASALDAASAAAGALESLANSNKRDHATTPQLRLALVTVEARPDASSAETFPYDAAVMATLHRLADEAWGWQIVCDQHAALLIGPELHLNLHRHVERLGLAQLPGEAEARVLFALRYGGSEGFRFPPPPHAVTAKGDRWLTTSTRFIGRAKELEDLAHLIADPSVRLVTIKGLGGIGKTRLALEAAEAQRDRLAVWSVSLVDLRDGALIPGEVVKALGETVPAGMDAETVICETLARRPSLLVLDNVEHLLAASVAFITTLLANVPTLTILATSRHNLQLSAEREYEIQPLPLPGPNDRPRWAPVVVATQFGGDDEAAGVADPVAGNDSVRLFVDRAVAKRQAFALTPDVAPDVVRLVTLLEGIPLAIELAAAKMAVLSPGQMADQIATAGERFRLLKAKAGDVHERHQSLQAAMDWSWDLLTAAQQRFLASLSVFRGGMTLEAAAFVTEDAEALDHLLALVDASLLQRVEVAGEREPRFGMLETVREYGWGQLEGYTEGGAAAPPCVPTPGDDDSQTGDVTNATTLIEELQGRHAQTFLRLVEEAEPQLIGGEVQTAWLSFLDHEYPNLLEVIRMGAEVASFEIATKIALGLYRYYLHRGRYTDGRRELDRLAPGLDITTKTDLHLQYYQTRGSLAWMSGDLDAAMADYKHALIGDGKSSSQHQLLHNLGSVSLERGDLAGALEYLESSRVLKEQHHEFVRLPNTLNNLSTTLLLLGNLDAAEEHAVSALSVATELCVSHGIVLSSEILGRVFTARGDTVRAKEHLDIAKSVAMSLADPRITANVAVATGLTLISLGDISGAAQEFVDARALAESCMDRRMLEQVRYLLAHCDTLREESRNAILPIRQAMEVLDACGDRLSAVEAARFLALAYVRENCFDKADIQLRHCLAYNDSIGCVLYLLADLEVVVELCAATGDAARAQSLSQSIDVVRIRRRIGQPGRNHSSPMIDSRATITSSPSPIETRSGPWRSIDLGMRIVNEM